MTLLIIDWTHISLGQLAGFVKGICYRPPASQSKGHFNISCTVALEWVVNNVDFEKIGCTLLPYTHADLTLSHRASSKT